MYKEEEVAEALETLQHNLELFYQQKNEEALAKNNENIELIEKIITTLVKIQEDEKVVECDENKLLKVLRDTVAAMEQRDYILMADIIQYDFVEYVQDILESIK